MAKAMTTRPSPASGKGVTNRTSANRGSAWTRGCREAACNRRFGIGEDVGTVTLDYERDMIVSRCIDKAVERKAVAARKAVAYGRWRRIMTMGDMRNRAHRECQQQSG
jgi:hypothetical protein